jgi:outer membrane beta-barrel protein
MNSKIKSELNSQSGNQSGTQVEKSNFIAIGLKVGVVLLALFWLMIVAGSWAEAATKTAPAPSDIHVDNTTPVNSNAITGNRAPASASEDEKAEASDYNFNWLDPEKKIYVLQNRRYTKAGHVFLNLLGGPGLANSYRTVWNVDPRIYYYFSEAFGLEAFYTKTFNSPNTTYSALINSAPTTVPVIREFNNEVGIMGQWVPWYAKINMFNKIIYFDWFLQAGFGEVSTDIQTQTNTTLPPVYQDQSFFALYVGTGHIYHISDDWTVRLDVRGAYYNAPTYGNSGSNSWFSNYNFEIGFGYRL